MHSWRWMHVCVYVRERDVRILMCVPTAWAQELGNLASLGHDVARHWARGVDAHTRLARPSRSSHRARSQPHAIVLHRLSARLPHTLEPMPCEPPSAAYLVSTIELSLSLTRRTRRMISIAAMATWGKCRHEPRTCQSHEGPAAVAMDWYRARAQHAASRAAASSEPRGRRSHSARTRRSLVREGSSWWHRGALDLPTQCRVHRYYHYCCYCC